MTDTEALRKIIEKSGLKYKAIAEKIGMNPYTLQRKIDNEAQFRVSEVDKLTSVLNLSDREKLAIFFAK